MKMYFRWITYLSLSLLPGAVFACAGINSILPTGERSITVLSEQPDEENVEWKENGLHAAYTNFAMASMLMKQGRAIEAKTYLEAALKQDPDSVYLNQKMAFLLKGLKDYISAGEYAQKSIDLDPDDMENRMIVAEIYEASGEKESAISEYKKLLVFDPGLQKARVALTSIYIREGQYLSALKHLDILIEQDPHMLMAHYYRARIHFELGDHAEAEKSYLEVLKLDDRVDPALFDLGSLYEQMPDKEEDAAEIYEKLLSLNPDDLMTRERLIEVYYKLGREEMVQEQIERMKRQVKPGEPLRRILGLIYLRHGKLDEAVAEFSSIISLWPRDDETRYYLAAAHEENQDHDTALYHFGLIRKESRSFVDAQIQIAYILENQERYDEAIESLQRAVEVDKRRNELYMMLASLFERKKEYGKAVDIIEKGLEQNTRDINLMFRLGVTLDRADEKEKGLQQMRRVLEIDPNHADALNYIGYTYAEQGRRLDEAMELIKRALESEPESGYIIDSLGWVYYQKGEYDEALNSLEKAVSLEPDEPEIIEHLGDVYFKKTRYEKSLEMYQRALSLNHSDKDKLKQKIEETTKLLE